MSQRETWRQKLRTLCDRSGWSEPTFQDVSDRRGGRTAWSCVAVVQGTHYSARFWYDGQYADQSREDASEMAWRTITGNLTTPAQHFSSSQTPASHSRYSQSSG
ncbi:hypothetical protein EJ04DRAFT_298764 [Polyplosphaeria fusca]|uniref:Uncharacterized protein n=1 Tax=Polyplosphaeria fusca TaxID=682080 RepID=A0A9P4QWY7_9PLEO|nr:hypothetical protein EJ04DRAFT_298764 [Polyplosphaeria fusca]